MKHSLKRKQERPKAFFGLGAALVGAAASLVGAGIGAYSSYRSRKEQEAALAHQAAVEDANSLTNQISTGIQNQDIVNRQLLGTAKYGKKKSLNSRSPVGEVRITDGGYAIPIGDGMNYLVGRTHEQKGFDGKTGIGIRYKKGGTKKKGKAEEEIEAEDKEVVWLDNNNMYVLSAQPQLGINGISPADLAANGITTKEQAFGIQESNKSGSINPLLASPLLYNQFGYPSLTNVNGMGFARLGGKKSTNIQDRKKARFGEVKVIDGKTYINRGSDWHDDWALETTFAAQYPEQYQQILNSGILDTAPTNINANYYVPRQIIDTQSQEQTGLDYLFPRRNIGGGIRSGNSMSRAIESQDPLAVKPPVTAPILSPTISREQMLSQGFLGDNMPAIPYDVTFAKPKRTLLRGENEWNYPDNPTRRKNFRLMQSPGEAEATVDYLYKHGYRPNLINSTTRGNNVLQNVSTNTSFGTDSIPYVSSDSLIITPAAANDTIAQQSFAVPIAAQDSVPTPQVKNISLTTPASKTKAKITTAPAAVKGATTKSITPPALSAPIIQSDSIQDRIAAQAQANQGFNPSLNTNPYWRPAFSTQLALNNTLSRFGIAPTQGLETTANTSIPEIKLLDNVSYATPGGINYSLTRADGSSFGNFGTPAVSTPIPAATTPPPAETPKQSWIDRNADWAGPAVGAIGSIGAALMNYYSARHQAMPHKPVLLNPARMISQSNINPQLAEFDRYAIVGQNNALQNTASSAAMRNQFNNINLNRVTEANKLWGTKTNEEVKMLNEDIKQRNMYANRNVDRLNEYYSALTAAQNQQRAIQSAALASIPEALANGFNQYLANRNTATLNDNDLYNILHGYEDNLDAKIPSTLTADQINRYNEQARRKGTKKLVPGKNGWEFTSARCGGKVSLKHNRF